MFTVRTLIDGIETDKDFPDDNEYVAWAYFKSTVERIRRSGWFEATVQVLVDGVLDYETTVVPHE